jgi:hypothetical protein
MNQNYFHSTSEVAPLLDSYNYKIDTGCAKADEEEENTVQSPDKKIKVILIEG